MFQMKYIIEKDFLTSGTKRRPGIRLSKVRFIVAHDTGNDGSTASGNVGYYERSAHEISASAHTFIDDKRIIECIPATLQIPEKAWHVRYNVTGDNIKYGVNANDAAIGVELCYSYKKGSINNKESYKRYVWYLAYLCYKYGLNPIKDIIGHNQLDPSRKTDPRNALQHLGKTLDNLITDVADEYKSCSGTGVPEYSVETPTETTLSSANALIQEHKEMEVEKLKLSKWQADTLVSTLSDLKNTGKFESQEWIDKAKRGTLTVSELTFLNTIMIQKVGK